MNIRETLQRERSKATCDEIVTYIGEDAQKLDELMQSVLSPEPKLSEMAAWVVTSLTDRNPGLISPYEQAMLEKVKAENNHEAVLRNFLRHWASFGFSEKVEGELYEFGFQVLEGPHSIAAKAHAMYVCMRVVEKYPDLAVEFKILMQEVVEKYGSNSAGIRSRGKKVLKRLDKIISSL
ncbi:hypothetical protein [Jiulongibacter sediminis]|jgi:hypothetical protein|uniref:hypothetical protein n=1 Tax=Jiulongibacter sediminis TaxID=1605367 RepID=UPI0026F15E26|nr:hypothetical protein [Jiulongibacter sediminis]